MHASLVDFPDASLTLSGVGDGALSRQFKWVRFLGAGPNGTGVAAQRIADGEPVELRFVQEHAQTDALLARWARYQLVQHPNVISLLQVENAGAEWCAVLDAPPQTTLSQRALSEKNRSQKSRSQKTLSRETTLHASAHELALRWLTQLASALAAAHELGLCHGELAQQTVRLDEQLNAQLEFTGVAISSQALPLEGAVHWQDADATTDVLSLAALAQILLPATALTGAEFAWLHAAQDQDPLKRPSAAHIHSSLQPVHARAVSARRALGSATTEPPQVQAVAQSPTKRRIGRFELEHLLGEGGMGSVYRARDMASGQHVALKVLREDLLSDQAVQYRFRKEARVLKELRSPYIANLIDADISAQHAYIALEFVDGEDLASACDNLGTPLDEELALQIVSDLCRALIEPHRRGIVHRDIKPQNVLLVGTLSDPQNLAIKLCDFGIASARLTPETMGMTQDGLLGTPQYMSPEQCRSETITPATDVYALGLTLYGLIAGRPAFEGADLIQMLRQQLSAQPKKLSQCAIVSDGTVALVERALHKDPGQRYVDAAHMLEAIEEVRQGAIAPQDASQAAEAHTRVRTIEFGVDLSSSAQALWPFVGDTDRMNEAVGLPAVKVERVREQNTLRTFLSNRVLGMHLRWEELPFEWIEGQGWSIHRRLESGLMRWYRVRPELEPLGDGGTRLRYVMQFEPRFSWLAWAIKFEVGVKQKAKLTRAFKRIDSLTRDGLVGRTPSPYAEPTQPSSRTVSVVSAKLEELRTRGVEADILKALQRHVLFGSETEIARLKPLRFARAHGLQERAVVEACLLGTRHGLFTLLWDVVCPLCQIPATFVESLARLKSHSECPACELSFPLKFAESVELVFRVASDVRPNEAQTYCIGGPAHSPHVAAQLRLAPGEYRVLALGLSDGRHRLRSPELPGVIELDVRAEHDFHRADLVVGNRLKLASDTPPQDEDGRLALRATQVSVQLSSGHQTVSLRNEFEREVTLRLERTSDRDDAFTAARAWAMPKFREWFPSETLQAGRLASVGELSFLVLRIVDHLALLDRQGDSLALSDTLGVVDRLQRAVERHHGQLASLTMDVAVATFERASDAMSAALELRDEVCTGNGIPCSLALHRGSAVATTIGDRMTYYGRAIVQAHEFSSTVAKGTLALSSVAIGNDLHRVSKLEPRLMQAAPMLGAAAWALHFAPSAPPVELPT